ncbi:hypothetical protein OH77DRAFT_1423076 [Trametes cingulata]|nr:hypothetical protein OH77DRAFT_1423076 [Trametes cingulata]
MDHRGSAQPERKRPRLSPEDEKPFVNHPTLYFDDGNVILQAGATLFCVHRSLLSKHSAVFRDLFAQEHAEFRGLPHISMEETPEEVEALLNVVYDGLRFEMRELTVETFPTLANLLRMATKYKVQRPCTDIISRIRAEWPSTLVQHDTKAAEARARLHKLYNSAQKQPAGEQGPAYAGPAHVPQPQQEDIIVHPAAVIALLRDCGYHDPDLLFPLFYALSRTTWQFGGPLLGHSLAPLSSADVERLVVGIERLRSAHTSFATVVPQHAAVPTNPPHFCMMGAAQLQTSMVPLLLPNAQNRAREPLEEWRGMISFVNTHYQQYQICLLCSRSITAHMESIRQRLWESLPRYFELA